MFELLVLAGIVLTTAYIVDMMDVIVFFVVLGLIALIFDPVRTSQRLGQMAIDLHDTVHHIMEQLK